MSEVLNIKAEIYENNQDCINLTFENHWNGGKKEAFAMLMWPSHSIEQTEEVEKAYEATARFLANAKSELSAKDEIIQSIQKSNEGLSDMNARYRLIDEPKLNQRIYELEQKLAEANEKYIALANFNAATLGAATELQSSGKGENDCRN